MQGRKEYFEKLFISYRLSARIPKGNFYRRLGQTLNAPVAFDFSWARQLYPATVFESLFDKVFGMCVDRGMVSGHTQALDSAPVKANASMKFTHRKSTASCATATVVFISFFSKSKNMLSSKQANVRFGKVQMVRGNGKLPDSILLMM